MTTLVNFEIAKLLKEKLFSWEVENFYRDSEYDKKFYLTTGTDYETDKNCIWDWNLHGGKSGMLTKIIPYPNNSKRTYYSAPSIAEVVMWLFEKHSIWIEVKSPDIPNTGYYFSIHKPNKFGNYYNGELLYFESPSEAYEEAITYTLLNLI